MSDKVVIRLVGKLKFMTIDYSQLDEVKDVNA